MISDALRERLANFQPKRGTKIEGAFRRAGVRDTAELRRIAHLPRRAIDLSCDLSDVLRRHDGVQLRPLQSAALYELATAGGLIALIKVGGGKTLISYLAPEVLEAQRPVLVVPAKLKGKTSREFAKLGKDWYCGAVPEIVSYEWLGREQAAPWLRSKNPDLIILDEGHRAKNPKAAVTRRLRRFVTENPTCSVVIMSGTLTKRSIREFAHLFEWALAERSPLPRAHVVIEEWASALDELLAPGAVRRSAGSLTQFFDESDAENPNELEAVRNAVRRRIVETTGVVASTDARIDASLSIELVPHDVPHPDVDQHLATLRTMWQTPDGEPIMDAVSKWRHAIELSLGFCYKWDPKPPIEWLVARRYWSATVRHILDHNRKELDSELQVARAVARGEYDGKILHNNGIPIGVGSVDATYKAWTALRDTFTPNTVPTWFDESVVLRAAAWLREGPGIVWCSHVAFAERLAERTGLSYYGAEGRCTVTRRPIEDASGPIIASIASSGEGRNLQTWSRNLVIPSTLDGGGAEQLIGRTHRPGQTSDEVTVEWLIACAEQYRGFVKARADAEYIERVTGSEQKLSYCDIVDPFEGRDLPVGPRWAS